MAVPKRRTPKSKKNKRRSHHGAVRVFLSPCPRCYQLKPGHVACPNCGTYQGREVVDVLARLDKKERKNKQKELEKQQEKET